MKSIVRTLTISIALLTLLPLTSPIYSRVPLNPSDYRQPAFGAIVAEAKRSTGGSVPASYLYSWGNSVEDDIAYFRTLASKDGDVCCVQFYATDGFNVWLGDVYLSMDTREVLDVSSEHIFTSGLTPFMSLLARFHADTMRSEVYGELTVVDRTDDFAEGLHADS